jgi:hypothetical protein
MIHSKHVLRSPSPLFNISETFDAKSTCTIVVFPMLVLGDSLVDTRRIERAGQMYLSKVLNPSNVSFFSG